MEHNDIDMPPICGRNECDNCARNLVDCNWYTAEECGDTNGSMYIEKENG